MRATCAMLAMLLPLACPPALAQPTDAEVAARRGVLERQQQSEAFAIELQQSQRRLAPMPGPAARARDLRDLAEMEQLYEEQLRRSGSPATSDTEASVFERARRAQALRFANEPPVWGPVLSPPGRWTPSLEGPERPWTPTLDRQPR